MEETKELITTDDIRSKVYIIRGQQVMLDKDLAEIYGYEVKKLNQQVKRNIERFPEDFMFRLSNSEIDSVRSQIVTSRKKDFFAGQEGGRRYLPYAFTEQVLLTILSSLAQDESRSISENCTWGIRRRFETGKQKMSTKRFLGYDTDETGKLVINRTQEPIVVRLYQEFMDGKTTDYIKRIFEREGVKNWDGGTKWQSTTLMSMLENEKYKVDALLQKSYTVDFLTKKRTQNKGEIQMFYVEDDYDAIISKRIWECVQLEIKRRKKYLEEHGTNSYSHLPESNPFASKIICGDCNKVFARKGWRSSTRVDRKVWQCSERYKVKGVMGCASRHVEEKTLIKAYLMAWNALVENREDFMEQWTEQLQSENLLESYRAEKFIEYIDGAKPLTEMDTDFMLKTLDHIKVFEDGTLLMVFLDGTEIECKNEEE